MENLNQEQIQQMFDESEKAMREALETINQLKKERENLLYFKTFEAIRDFFREKNIKMNANDPDTLLTHFVLKGQDYLNELTALKHEIEGLKEESAHYKKMYINELDAYPALKKLNQSQSLRIKELEEGLGELWRQLVKSGDDINIATITKDKVKSLLSTPTTEPKEVNEECNAQTCFVQCQKFKGCKKQF